MDYIKPHKLNQFAEPLGLTEVVIHEGMSFVLGCRFYKTKHDDILITDYDFENQSDSERNDLYFLFYRKNRLFASQVISGMALEDVDVFKFVVSEFSNYVKGQLENKP